MNSRLDNKLSSAEAVTKVGEKFKTVKDGIPALKKAFDDHDAQVVKIKETRQETEISTKGPTNEKGALRKTFGQAAVEMTSSLSALGGDTKNMELQAQTNYSASDFLYGRVSLSLDKARIIYNLAQKHIEELKLKYGTTDEELLELKRLIDALADANPTPVVVRNERKGANVVLRNQFKDLGILYKERLDKIMKKLETSQPIFYSGYNNARNILNLGVRHEEGTAPKSKSKKATKKSAKVQEPATEVQKDV